MSEQPAHRAFDMPDFRMACFAAACVFYAIFGSPTPDSIGWVEIVIAVLMVVAIGIGRMRDVLFSLESKRFWKSAAQILMIYGISVPVIVGAVAGNSVQSMLRDLAPFMFLFLPLFLLPLIRARLFYFRVTLVAVVIIGLLFALRSVVMEHYGDCPVWCTDELLYLENMPTVLFACLFLIGIAMSVLMQGFSIGRFAVFAVLVGLALVPVAAMAETLQRASIGALVLYMIILQGYFLYRSPMRAFAVLAIGVAAIFIINISFSTMFDELWTKTRSVGLNNRPQEFMAVWDVVSRDPVTFLLGIGWGGQFHSPAVGGLSVNFTHNFFSTILLKTGIVGVVLCVAYVGGLLERLGRVVLVWPVLGLALAAPVLIDLTLYASFKSFDFGLMLLMIVGSLVYSRDSESTEVTNDYA